MIAVSRKFETRSSRSLPTIESGCGASSQLLFAYCPQMNNPPPQRPAPAAPREINYLLRSADFSRRDVSSFPLRCRVFPRCPLFWPRRATLPTLNLRPTNLFCIRAYNGVLLTGKANGLPMVYQWFTNGLPMVFQSKLSHREFVQSPTILKRIPNSLFIWEIDEFVGHFV